MKVLTKTKTLTNFRITNPCITIQKRMILAKERFNFFQKGEYIALVELPQGLAVAVSKTSLSGFTKVLLCGPKNNRDLRATFNSDNWELLESKKGRHEVTESIEVDGIKCLLIKPLNKPQ